jgi:hypothetical protein
VTPTRSSGSWIESAVAGQNEIAEEPAAFNSRTLDLAAPLFSHYLLVVITTE